MNKTKKASDGAMMELRDYLRRDRDAIALLDSLERYTGELRRANSLLKDETESLRQSNQTLRAKSFDDASAITAVRAELATEQAKSRQAEAALALERKRFDELAAATVPESSGDAEMDASDWWKLFKALRRRMPNAPPPLSKIEHHGEKGLLFDLKHFFSPRKTSSMDDCTTIGLFILVAQSSHFPIVAMKGFQNEGFTAAAKAEWKERSDARGQQFAKWFASMMFVPDFEHKILEAGGLAQIKELQAAHIPMEYNPRK